MLGGHVGNGAAHRGSHLGIHAAQVLGDVEVQEQGLTIAANQNVGGLDIAMDNAALVGVLQRFGQVQNDPGHGTKVGHLTQEIQWGGAGTEGHARFPLEQSISVFVGNGRVHDPPKRVNQLCPLLRPLALLPETLQHDGERCTTEVRHAHRPQAGAGIFVDGVNGHNMRVLQLRERLRLISVDTGDFQHDGPPCQIFLLGQEHAGEGPAAQFAPQAEAEQRRAFFRQVGQPRFADLLSLDRHRSLILACDGLLLRIGSITRVTVMGADIVHSTDPFCQSSSIAKNRPYTQVE